MEPTGNGFDCRAATGIAKVCAGNTNIHIREVNGPQLRSEENKPARVPRNVLRLMLAIVIVLALVALYANVQRWRRSQLETVTFTPAQTASPSSATP
jgi:hypothetical protein